MSPDAQLLLIAATGPAAFILPWRVRFCMKWGWLRLLVAVLVTWPLVTVSAVREIDRAVPAYWAEQEDRRDRGESYDKDYVMHDGVGDRVAMLVLGGLLPLAVALPMLLIRYLIDLALIRSHSHLGAAVVIAVFSLCVGCSSGSDSTAAAQASSVHALADQRARAAELWFGRLVDRKDAGEALTPQFLEQLLDAATARAKAQADAATSDEAKMAAYRTQREFCQRLLQTLEDAKDAKPAPVVVARLRYAIADAEYNMGRHQKLD